MATNISILCGRFTKDTEVRYAGENNAIASNTLAVPEDYKAPDGTVHTNFISITAFGKKAEFMEKFAKKGSKFIVTGRIRTGSYKNKNGDTVYTTDIVAETFEFAESKKDAPTQQATQPSQPVAPAEEAVAPTPAAPAPVEEVAPTAQPVVAPAPVEEFSGDLMDVFE